jgi:glutamate-1-semialdehyde 2,1-aminomutase
MSMAENSLTCRWDLAQCLQVILNPTVVGESKKALDSGMLFVTPSPISRDAGERLCKRFNIDQVRFANSGTEATMYAVRTAKAYTGKNAMVKVEGGYHGSSDPMTVSAKPALSEAGPADEPHAVIQDGTIPGVVFVVPFNNLEALEKVFARDHNSIACFIVEPVLENLAIVLPEDGYLEGVRALCDKYGIVLIFDEVKTGLTAGPHGAAVRLGVQPDLITLAKSIGGECRLLPSVVRKSSWMRSLIIACHTLALSMVIH